MIHTLALVGFRPHEQHLLGIFFKMTIRREHSYQVVANPAESQILLVDADSATGLGWIRDMAMPHQKILLVGKTGVTSVSSASSSTPVTSSSPVIHRPYAMVKLVEKLDLFFGSPVAKTTPARAVPEPLAKTSPTPVQALKPVAAPAGQQPGNSVRQGTGVAARAGKPAESHAASSFLGFNEELPTGSATSTFDDILVVDDSDVALRFMQKLLTRFGFRAELARSGEEALARTSTKNYKFVFIDVMMDGMDGYQTCRAIKQRKYADTKPPIIVMLTSRGASLDKMRGSLAGCDAYLTKPLEEHSLLQTLSKYDEQVQRGFQETKIGMSDMGRL